MAFRRLNRQTKGSTSRLSWNPPVFGGRKLQQSRSNDEIIYGTSNLAINFASEPKTYTGLTRYLVFEYTICYKQIGIDL